jgi:hypothetical protein
MKVDIWAEVTRPWCGLGNYRLAKAIERFEHARTDRGCRRQVRDDAARAQDSDSLLELLRKAWNDSHPLTYAGDAPVCGGPVRAAEAGTDKPGARINRADLAQFLVQTIEDDAGIRKAPLV